MPNEPRSANCGICSLKMPFSVQATASHAVHRGELLCYVLSFVAVQASHCGPLPVLHWVVCGVFLLLLSCSGSFYILDACLNANLLPLFLTLCDPTLLSNGILQARTLKWVAMPSSRGSSQPKDRTLISYISCTAGGFFTTSTTWEVPNILDIYPLFYLICICLYTHTWEQKFKVCTYLC